MILHIHPPLPIHEAKTIGASIEGVEEKIRDFLTCPRKHLLKDWAKWNILNSAMDLIGDTEMAIEAYLNSKDGGDSGLQYLLIYGILQILFVQQDAAKLISDALRLPYEHCDELLKIREIRNDTVGHPANRNGGTRSSFLVRCSMTKQGYTLLTTHSNGEPDSQEVNLIELINNQRGVIFTVLTHVIDRLNNEDMEHKKKFKDTKLMDFFPASNSYHLGKIFEICPEASDQARIIAGISTKIIRENLTKFRLALVERGEFSDTLEYEIEETAYPIAELDCFFNSRESKLNDRDASIFAFFIRHKLGELEEMAKAIDAEYCVDSSMQDADKQ